MPHNELETKEKYNTIESLLTGDHVFVHVDSRTAGTKLPNELSDKHSVTLKLSRLFRGKVELTKDGITADLLFPEGYHSCEVPFEAIWGITDESGKNMIWPQSTPKEVLEEMITADEAEAIGEEPKLEVVQGDVDSPKEEEEDSDSKVAKKKIPHLKRVK